MSRPSSRKQSSTAHAGTGGGSLHALAAIRNFQREQEKASGKRVTEGNGQVEEASDDVGVPMHDQPQAASNSAARPVQPNGQTLPPNAAPSTISIAQKKDVPVHAAKHEQDTSPVERAKRMAAFRAVDAHIKPHHRVIGIGSGSTVPYVVDRILQLGRAANAKRWVSAT